MIINYPYSNSLEDIKRMVDQINISLNRVVANSQVSQFPPFSRFYESDEQIITSADLLTLPHSLSAEPELVQIWLVCKVAENGWLVGDKVLIHDHSSTSAADNYGLSLWMDETNIYIRYGAAATTTLLGHHKTAGTGLALTNTNWKIIVKAWA